MKSTVVKLATVAVSIVCTFGQPGESATFWPKKSMPLSENKLRAMGARRVSELPGYSLIDDQAFSDRVTVLSGFSADPWPNGKLIYQFDSSVDIGKQLVFITSCQLWSAVAKVTCVARTTEANYVVVSDSSENRATVGFPKTNPGFIHIFNWNRPYIVAHEIGHSLGLAHEQCRSDRDTKVQILSANIKTGEAGNFTKQTTVNPTSYDFDSVMHYSGDAFGVTDAAGKPKMTILVLPPNEAQQSHIGQRDHLSTADAAGMASRYGKPVP